MARNPSGSEGLQTLVKAHSNVIALKVDVTKPADWKSAAGAVGKRTGGSLDVLIHNAAATDPSGMIFTAYGSGNGATELKAAIHADLDVNTLSILDGNDAFLPLILTGKEKKIIAISSAMGVPEFVMKSEAIVAVPYSLSKAASNLLVAKYAAELKPQGVKVLAINPGWVATQAGALGIFVDGVLS
jgi:NAD(P)-dependent dehydrogenase (short-subunit alcohol dehydrogenase family)